MEITHVGPCTGLGRPGKASKVWKAWEGFVRVFKGSCGVLLRRIEASMTFLSGREASHGNLQSLPRLSEAFQSLPVISQTREVFKAQCFVYLGGETGWLVYPGGTMSPPLGIRRSPLMLKVAWDASDDTPFRIPRGGLLVPPWVDGYFRIPKAPPGPPGRHR